MTRVDTLVWGAYDTLRSTSFLTTTGWGPVRVQTVRYIAIEGVIGVGKTSLVHRLHSERGGARILEIVEENPFLVGGFYQDMERYAFNTEMFFLLARFRQQRDVDKALVETEGMVLADYVFDKNRIFAELTLSEEDYPIWKRLFDTLSPEATAPDLAIYLRAGTDELMDRIRTRNRPFEKEITFEYIDRLNEAYDRFFRAYEGSLLTIDVSRLDYVSREADFAAVRAMIDHRVAAAEAGQREFGFIEQVAR